MSEEFMDTVDLERSILKLLTKSKMYANLYMHKAKAEYFTSEQRKFIFGCAQRIQTDSKSQLTTKLLEFEIKHRIDPGDQVIYEGEWNIIDSLNVSESPESIVDKLQEAATGRKVMDSLDDVVELLSKGDVQRAVEALKQSAMQINMVKDDQPIRCLTDYEHRLERIRDKQNHPEKYAGLKTGIFPTFDKKTGGFFNGELTLLAGVTGLGKSTLMKALEWGLVRTNPGINVLHIANEEYSEQVENKFDALITEIPYSDFKFGKITDDDVAVWESKMKEVKAGQGVEYGGIYTKEVPAFTDVTLVEQAYRELENQGIKIDVILIDHLPHIVPIMKAYGENDERWKAAGDCKELARSLRVPVVIPTQAATEVEEKQNKGKRAGKLDVYGSKGQVHVANNFLIITMRGKDNTQVDRLEYERDVYWLVDCKKNRDGPPFNFLAKHHVFFGKVEEVLEDSDGNTAGDDHTADSSQKQLADDILKEMESENEEADKAKEESSDEPVVDMSTEVVDVTPEVVRVEPEVVRVEPEVVRVPVEVDNQVEEISPDIEIVSEKKPISALEKMRARKAKNNSH